MVSGYFNQKYIGGTSMKKRKFNAKAMRKFTTEPKVVHEAKPIDLITQYNRMRSIATDIYNSDFYMIAAKAEQKKIEASITCISATMISMIGMEAIKNSHDNLPDDSGEYTDTDKASHDAIKKMKNIAYGETKPDSVKKAAARQVLNSVYGATHPIMAMNRKILSELGTKSPMQIMHECLAHTNNEHDDDSDGDEVKKFEVNLGNFTDGPSSYGQQYLDICKQYGFDAAETLKQFEKLASYYYIQMISLVDVVDSQDEITADKYTLEPGSVFFITNKKNSSKSPVFILVYMQPYTKTRSFDISRFSIEIAPEHHIEESTKTNDIEFINSNAYFNIGKVHMNHDIIINLDATLVKIKDEARMHGIDTITFVDTIEYMIDISTEDKYTLKPGDVFFHKGDGWKSFMLVVEDKVVSDRIHVLFIEPVWDVEEKANPDDIEFIGIDAYYNIDTTFTNPNYVINLDDTLRKIKKRAKETGIKTITFVDTIEEHEDLYADGKYSLEPGSLFFVKEGYLRFILINETNPTVCQYIDPVVIKKNDSEEDDIKFVCAYYYYKIDTSCPNSAIIDLDATLAKIKERARAKNIKTIKFAGTTKDRLDIFYTGKYSKAGSLYYLKNDERPRFILITGNIDYVNLPMHEDIDPVMVVKKDDSEDESNSKEDGIEAVEAEDKIVDSDEASIDHGINDRYANVDTNEISCDNYAKVSFSLFMESTENSENISFVDICNIYDFDVFATIKRIKSVAYLNDLESIKFAGTVYSHEEISEKEALCDNGSVLFVSDAEDPYFIIIKYCGRTTWLNRINPVEK